MRLRTISIRNYRRYKSAELELPDGMISIVGPNGSGKSTLLEAFAWALFGNQAEIVRTGKESIKRQGAAHTDPCSVRIEFDFEDTGYVVERTMKGKNLTMSAEMFAGNSLMAKGTDDVSEALVKLFGMDHKSFFISVFARQTELNALTSQPKGDRKKLVLRLLDIENVDEAIKRIREDIRLAKETIKTARAELTAPDGSPAIGKLEADLGALSVLGKRLAKDGAKKQEDIRALENIQAKLGKEMASLESKAREKAKLDAALASLRKESASLETQRDELTEELSGLAQAEEEFARQEPKAGKTAEELESILAKKKESLAERDAVRSEMAGNRAGSRQLEKEIKETRSSMDDIAGMGPESDCPTCRRKLGEAYEKLLAEFEGQIKEKQRKLKLLEKEFSALEIRLKDCEGKSEALEKQEARLREKKTKFEKLRFQMEHASKLRAKLDDAARKLDASKEEFEKARQKSEVLDFDEKAYAVSRKALDETAAEMKSANRDLLHLTTELARNEERLKASQANLERLKDIEHKNAGQETMITLLMSLETVMGDFRTHLIARIRPALASASSELLGVLTDGRYSELQLDEDYEISIVDSGEPHGLERFSGGEKDLANLCLRLAISEIIATRHGTNSFDLIVLDEIFGSQDASRKRTLLSTLNGLSNRFKQIFLITHVEDVKELMGNVIQVTENPDGTSSARVSQ
jgi:exonuclease SbcC